MTRKKKCTCSNDLDADDNSDHEDESRERERWKRYVDLRLTGCILNFKRGDRGIRGAPGIDWFLSGAASWTASPAGKVSVSA